MGGTASSSAGATAVAGASATGGSANATGGSVVGSGNSAVRVDTSQQQGQQQGQLQGQALIDSSQHTATSDATQSQTATGGAGGSAAQGQKQRVDNSGNNTGTANVTVEGDQAQARNPVSTAYAPTIVTGSDQCLVPVSAGGQAVTFGISFGTAVADTICEALKLARQLDAFGYREQALKLLKAADPRVAAAFQ